MIEESRHPSDCHWHRDWHACNCGLFEILVYSEPNVNDNIKLCRITVEAAIDSQIKYAKNMGHFYQDQNEALSDFIAFHWAKYEVI